MERKEDLTNRLKKLMENSEDPEVRKVYEKLLKNEDVLYRFEDDNKEDSNNKQELEQAKQDGLTVDGIREELKNRSYRTDYENDINSDIAVNSLASLEEKMKQQKKAEKLEADSLLGGVVEKIVDRKEYAEENSNSKSKLEDYLEKDPKSENTYESYNIDGNFMNNESYDIEQGNSSLELVDEKQENNNYAEIQELENNNLSSSDIEQESNEESFLRNTQNTSGFDNAASSDISQDSAYTINTESVQENLGFENSNFSNLERSQESDFLENIENSQREEIERQFDGINQNNQRHITNSQNSNMFYTENIKKEKKKSTLTVKFVVALLIISIVGGSSLGFTNAYVSNQLAEKNQANYSSANHASGEALSQRNEILIDENTSLVKNAINNVSPAVVEIYIEIAGQDSNVPFFGGGTSYASGSGIIYKETEDKLYIATNNHVIAGASFIGLSFKDEPVSEDLTADIKGFTPAKIVGTKAESDLAVIAVEKRNLTEHQEEVYKVAQFGDSEIMEVGDSVVVIGNALGYGTTSTGGMISAKSKKIQFSDGNVLDLLQTDAAINSGNSGGALVNLNSEVVGINTAKLSSSGGVLSGSASIEGMGFAIPSGTAVPILNDLIDNPESEPFLYDSSYTAEANVKAKDNDPFLGIKVQNISYLDETGASFRALQVVEVMNLGSAQAAGIKAGDIIVEYDGIAVVDSSELQDLVLKNSVGDKVKVAIQRQDQVLDIEVTLVSKIATEID